MRESNGNAVKGKGLGELTLGWRVTSSLAPKYWLSNEAKAGCQAAEDLIKVPAETIARHAAVIAQSGSGKSFFLGRLIEETLLETKARCVILDPNGDFRKMSEVVGNTCWQSAGYDHKTSSGALPHEPNGEVFANRWSQIDKRFLTGPSLNRRGFKRLKLSWPSLSMDFLAEDVNGMARTELYHCHQFIKSVFFLIEAKDILEDYRQSTTETRNTRSSGGDAFETARKIFQRASSAQPHDRIETIERDFQELLGNISGQELGLISERMTISPMVKMFQFSVRRRISQAAAAVEYVSPAVAHYYYGKAKEYAAQGILQMIGKTNPVQKARLEVIDLSSFRDRRSSLLALNSVLATEWESARSEWERAMNADAEMPDYRVPTFIVVDEAHNLISQQPRGLAAEALREQFRTIAAEGRKYGLFLIICTQRPDKIDPMVLSECENRVIMRLGSRSVLEITRNLLGLEDISPSLLAKTLEFEKGRALIMGPWSGSNPEIFYTAMRRTVEGGKNLHASHWASPNLRTDRRPSASNREKSKPVAVSASKVKKPNTKKRQTKKTRE